MNSESRFVTMDAEEIKSFISSTEHKEVYDEETTETYFCFTSPWLDCEVCKAEKELGWRQHVRESKKPGHCTFLTNFSYSNMSAGDLKVGDQARYSSRPGLTDLTYAEVLEIIPSDDKKIHVVWRTTNSENKFDCSYRANESLDVCRDMRIFSNE